MTAQARPKGRAANGGGTECRPVHLWPVCSTRDLPRPAPRQRPGPAYGLVLLGDPTSFDEDDSDPHGCVKPLDAVALPSLAATAACRTRHGPAASCSAPMASRLRYLVTVYGPGCLPGHRDYLKRHDSLGFDSGRLLCPVVPREPSERLARPPPAVSDVHAARIRAHGASGSIRPRRPSTERRGVSVPTRVHPRRSAAHTPIQSRSGDCRLKFAGDILVAERLLRSAELAEVTSYAAQTDPGAFIGRVVGDWNAASAMRANDALLDVHPREPQSSALWGKSPSSSGEYGADRQEFAGGRMREAVFTD